MAGAELAVRANPSQLHQRQARPLPYTAVTLPAVTLVPSYIAWWQRPMCVNNLPMWLIWLVAWRSW